MRLFDFDDDNIILQTDHDFKGFDFVWYDKPVDHFDLQDVSHRIISFHQLQYYAEVFIYLNPDMDFVADDFSVSDFQKPLWHDLTHPYRVATDLPGQQR